jgi:transglutaminase-like putative cysteine protease
MLSPAGFAETEQTFSVLLQKMEKTLTQLEAIESVDHQRRAVDEQADEERVDAAQLQQTFQALKQALTALDEKTRDYFGTVATHLHNQSLPKTIQQRHLDAVATYRRQMDALLENLEPASTGGDSLQSRRRSGDLATYLRSLIQPGTMVDDSQSFYVPDENPQPARENKKEFKSSSKTIALAATDLPIGLLLAQAEGAPNAHDLAPTVDVQITDEIIALAQTLGNPLAIYAWVYNHIEFIPTYGSIQGAQMTLATRKGNAFDTASLLIALLRAANVHARYAYGTIQLPIDKVKNWLGDLTAPESVVALLSQGGIPTTPVTQGGKITAVKMEHVWVEAWIDYFPSRGAKHQTGEGDSWIPLDASFKQYQFTPGLPLHAQVPFDTPKLVRKISSKSWGNEDRGYLKWSDTRFIDPILETYQQQLAPHLQASVATVIGGHSIVLTDLPMLAADLPYQVLVRGRQFAEIPYELRHRLQFDLYENETDRVLDKPLLSFTTSLPQLADKSMTLSFAAHSADDEAVIKSYLQSGQVPADLPGYLIYLQASLKAGDEVIEQAGKFMLGQMLSSRIILTHPNQALTIYNRPIAGAHQTMAVNLQGISSKQIQTAREQLEKVKNALEIQDLNLLSQGEVLDRVLHLIGLNYLALQDLSLDTLNRLGKVISYRQPSVVTALTYLKPRYSFGIPQQVEMKGIALDVEMSAQSLWAKTNDKLITEITGHQLGTQMSAWQHQVLDAFIPHTLTEVALSTTRALAMAAVDKQYFYRVNESNLNTMLRKLTRANLMPETESEIQAAIQVGKTVLISQKPVAGEGWQSRGYAISNKAGVGTYKLEEKGISSLLPWSNLPMIIPSLWIAPADVFAQIGAPFVDANLLLSTQGLIVPNVLKAVLSSEEVKAATISPLLATWLIFDKLGTTLGATIVGDTTNFMITNYFWDKF